ncbi:phage tail protein [Enterobacter kobei]|nr:phage tail protein [Enterobacter kobei]
MGDYYIIITDAGVALEAAAHAAGEPVVLTAFGVCDGGAAFTPDPTQTTLENEIDRWDISSLSVSPDDNSVLIAQCIIPASSGGYTIRGMGLYAGDTLYAVGNYPDQPKPAPDSGYAASLEILAQLAVSDTADVTLNVTDGAWLTKEEGDQMYVPLARKINGHELSADLTLTPADIGAVPPERTINGHPLSTDINVTAQDIFNGQALGIGDAADLNSYTTPGLYYQPMNAQASTGKNYPKASAGSLEVYKHAGITQIYRVYNSSLTYIRTLYNGTWSAWTKQYDAANKPSAGDVGALPITGGTLKGALAVVQNGPGVTLQSSASGQAAYVIGKDYNGDNSWYVGRGGSSFNISFYNYKGANGININEDGSIALNPLKGKSATVNGSLQVGAVGSGILNIGDTDSGLRSSKDGQVDLYANSHLMGYWNTTTFSFTGQIIPTNYTNFDARYYTKTLADGRYVQNVRVGAVGTFKINKDVWNEAPVGAFMTGWYYEGDNPGGDSVHYRPIQVNVNGAWRTITA